MPEISRFIELHQEALLENWQLVSHNQTANKLNGLR
jgi:hypothetical protein